MPRRSRGSPWRWAPAAALSSRPCRRSRSTSSSARWVRAPFAERHRDAGGEGRVRDDELAVDFERASFTALVEEAEHERRYCLAADVLGRCGSERLLEQRLDIDAVLRRVAEKKARAAELPVGARDLGGCLRLVHARGDGRAAGGRVEEREGPRAGGGHRGGER